MKFTVAVTQEWTETGTITIEAESEDDARDQAEELLAQGSDAIEWSNEFDPGSTNIESVSEAELFN